MKKLFFSVVAMMVAVMSLAQNERTAKDVEPGIKGTLPTELPVIAQAEEGRFGGLMIDQVTYRAGWSNQVEAWLKFPYASSYGGDYYLLQYRGSSSEAWTTDDYHYEYDNAAVTKEGNFFRIIIQGGPMDGYVSNEVHLPNPVVSGCFVQSWSTRGTYENLMVGSKLRVNYVTVYKYDDPNPDKDETGYTLPYKIYENEDGCYRYQWYRRNPNTGDMTAIEGATDEYYTPTIDDVGYHIFEIVSGDDRTLSFTQGYDHGLIHIPITSSIAYLDNNGFVLNTEYVLPNPGKNLIMERYDNETGETIEGPLGDAVKEVKPGQYAITMDRDLFDYSLLKYADSPYFLSFVYTMPVWGEGEEPEGYEEMCREAQILGERYIRPLTIKPVFKGIPVSTSVDILGKGVDGKLNVVATLTAEEAEDGVFSTEVFKGKYFIKTHATQGMADTYYPSALVWTEAEIVEPDATDWSEDWQPTSAIIEMVEALAPLQGSSTIEGTITVQASAANARTRGGSDMTYTVFLKDVSTDKMIAQTQTDASGKYIFENVPIGDFIVVPNIDGYREKAAKPLAVKVSKENQAITDIDCTMAELSIEEIFQEEGEYLAGDADGNGTVDSQDIAAIVEYLTGKTPEKFNKRNADANNDKMINIADIVEIVNKITQ